VIVVDSSVWIDFFNGRTTAQTAKLLATLGEEPVLVGDLVLCEVLRGVRSETQALIVESELSKFELVQMLDPGLAVTAARHYRVLREKGVTVRKTIDLIIGTFCIAHGHSLLHADRDFDPMATWLGLQVVPADWGVNEPQTPVRTTKRARSR